VTADRDDIYRADGDDVEPFEFSERVVRVFPDMIERSVPGYRPLLEMLPLVVRNAARPDTRIYDLGASLGAATLAARRAVAVDGVEIIAVDDSRPMVERCRELVAADNSRVPVDVVHADIRDVPIDNASVVLLLFTLQFLPVAARDGLIARIRDGLVDGGVLLLAEKLAFDEPGQQRWMDDHHADFKRAHGYSDLEIARKRQALENVLVPETRQAHHHRLKNAGFGEVHDWFQAFNFGCMAAVN
jgi:tRNA (cmo5U34)-methyltransferase